MSYGAKSNAELLLFYGFCVENNPYDDVPLSLELPQGEVAEVTRAERMPAEVAAATLAARRARRQRRRAGAHGPRCACSRDAAALATCAQDPRIVPVSSEGEPAAAAALCGALAALVEQLDAGTPRSRPRRAPPPRRARPGGGAGGGEVPRGRAADARGGRGEARAWRAAVGGGPDPSLGKRTRD